MRDSVLKSLVIVFGLVLPAPVMAGPIYPVFVQPGAVLDQNLGTDLPLVLADCHDSGNSGGSGTGGGPGGGLLMLNSGSGGGGGCGDRPGAGGGAALNKGKTNAIVKIIEGANRTCGSKNMGGQYKADCLRVYYGWVADQLPDTGDYAPIKKAMRQAEAKLDRIVRANLDTSAEAITPREGYKPNAKRMPPIRAVKKGATKKVARQAEAVVKETELLIVRSGGDPERRKPHYDAVAAAVDDNLVILRSA